MKQFFMIMVMLMSSILPVCAQEQIEALSYSSEKVVDRKIGLPIVRSIYGGTKIIPKYVGDWTYEMKGAFEYACRIWEEAMPTTFPIQMKVVLDDKTEDYANLPVFAKCGFRFVKSSEASVERFNFVAPYAPWSQIKACTWLNRSGVYDDFAFWDMLTPNMFQEPEITITYYNYGQKLKRECSFSLDETLDSDYYDFVTMALRDIAKSFGLMWDGKMMSPDKLKIPLKLIPFEKNVINVIGNDPHEAYIKATAGKIIVGREKKKWELYAPSIWEDGSSLNYFIPNVSQEITNLLSCEYGKGTVVRNIASRDTYKMFDGLLNWTGDVAVGIGTGNTGCSERETSTEKVLPFKGIFSSNGVRLKTFGTYALNDSFPSTKEEIPSYIEKFIPMVDKPFAGIDVAFLKQDGTWDDVYYEPGINNDSDINISDFELHYDINSYARSCDGYIRCRVMKYRPEAGKMYASVYYYLLDYLPEKVQLAKSATIVKNMEDDYLRDVKIDYKNIEGVTKIVVSQLDEYNELPYHYELKDFKKGSFIATVDKDYTSTFSITAYNQNGSTESLPYVLQPLDPSPVDVKFCLKNQNINILTSRRRARTLNEENLISKVKINSLETNEEIKLNRQNRIDEINISPLPKGHYVLTVYDVYERKHIFKFSR